MTTGPRLTTVHDHMTELNYRIVIRSCMGLLYINFQFDSILSLIIPHWLPLLAV